MLGDAAAARRLDSAPRGYGIRLALAEVKGISEAEVARIVAGRPYGSLADFWHRAGVARPVVERLVVAGAFDALYGIGVGRSPGRPAGRAGSPAATCCCRSASSTGGPARWPRSARSGGRSRRTPATTRPGGRTDIAVAAASGESLTTVQRAGVGRRTCADRLAARQSQAARPVVAAPVQLALDLGRRPRGRSSPAGCRR